MVDINSWYICGPKNAPLSPWGDKELHVIGSRLGVDYVFEPVRRDADITRRLAEAYPVWRDLCDAYLAVPWGGVTLS